MKTSKIAALLIDMQKCFIEDLKQGEEEKIVPCQIKIIDDFCVKRGIPLIVLEYSGCGTTIRLLRDKISEVPKLKIITKTNDDGFINTDLLSHLKTRGVDTLLLMGINADYCVRSTAKSAIRQGYKIVTSKKLIAGKPYHSRNKSGDWYAQNGAFYADMDSLLERLERIVA